MKHVGDEVTEVLEYQPGKLWVRRIVRRKYARKDAREGESGVVIAPMPDQAFPKCKAGVSLMAYLLLSKFSDHLPLHRINQMLARQGIKIPDTSLAEWVKMAIMRLDSLICPGGRTTGLKNCWSHSADTCKVTGTPFMSC